MKKIFRFIHAKENIYIQFIYNMFIILIIPFFMLMLVYSGLNSKIKESTYERNLGMLESSVQKVDLMLNNLDQIMLYFKDNVNIIKFFNMNDRSMRNAATDMIRAQNDLSAMKIANDDILNIQMYSGLSNSLIDYNTVAYYIDRYYGSSFYLNGLSYQQFLNVYLNDSEPKTYSSAIMTVNQMTNEVLIYSVYYTGTNFRFNDNRIIFYVNKDSILQFFNTSEYQQYGFICIID